MAFHGVLADLQEVFRFPSVATEERDGEAELLGLDGDEGDVIIITGDEHRVRCGALDGGELGLEILVAAVVVELGGQRAAVFGELLFEILGEALGVVAFRVGEDGDFFRLEGFIGEVRHHGALERIDEADAENVVAHFGDFRVGGRRGNHRDFRRLGDRRGFERAAGSDLAEDGDHTVAGNEFIDDVGGFTGFGLIVLGE